MTSTKILDFFDPLPLVIYRNQLILFLLSAFWVPPYPTQLPTVDVMYGSPQCVISYFILHPSSDDIPQRDKKTNSPTQEEEGESHEDGGGPRAKTRLSKILSNVPKVNEESKSQGPNPDEFSSDEVLGTVKFDAGVLREVESSRCSHYVVKDYSVQQLN